jgi:hypothetical protein
MKRLLLLVAALAISPLTLADHHGKPHGPCDVNGDGIVTRTDIDSIKRAVKTPGDGARDKADPRDVNRDGKVTQSDVNACVQKCTYKKCAAK